MKEKMQRIGSAILCLLIACTLIGTAGQITAKAEMQSMQSTTMRAGTVQTAAAETGTTQMAFVQTKGIQAAHASAQATKMLAAPVITSIKQAGNGKLLIKWKKVSGANGYVIYRHATKNGSYKRIKIIKSVKTLKYTDSGLKSGKKYYYKIRAYKTVSGKEVLGKVSAIKSKTTKKAVASSSNTGGSDKGNNGGTGNTVGNTSGNTDTGSGTGDYVGNSNTRKFHTSTCRYVGQISAGNRVSGSRDYFILQGYSPCRVCHP